MSTSMTQLDVLYRSLQERRRPEDVAELIGGVLADELRPREARALHAAARGSLRQRIFGHTSMPQTFARPVGLTPQVSRARLLFSTFPRRAVVADDPDEVQALVVALSAEIGKTVGASDFLGNRLNGEQRTWAGVPDSRRRYNRKFRLLRRLERKLAALGQQLEHSDLTLVGKSGFASRLTHEQFVRGRAAACFIAYLVARKNLRSKFTIHGQTQAFDEVAELLLARASTDPMTPWAAVAAVYPVREVVARLDDVERLTLFGDWTTVLYRLADKLASLWERSRFERMRMTVRRGDDSTTWNQLATAWNTARDSWMALTYALGMEAVLEQACPGKVMRLVAGDLAAIHAAAGHGTEANTQVWATLPLPWEVLRGQARCNRATIEAACLQVSLDPRASGWVAPRPSRLAVPFTPTPELVHGVVVGNPHLATFLRKAGWWSGKGPRGEVVAGEVAAAVTAAKAEVDVN